MTKVFYIANSKELEKALQLVSYYTTVDRQLIEMDYSEVTVTANKILNMVHAEQILAELV